MKKIEKIQKALALQNNKENQNITQELITTLDTNVDFSLDVDPTNKYNISDEQKDFVRNYINLKNIPLAAELTGIDDVKAKAYFVAYSSQEEIRRINKAMYQRQFANKMLTIDEIGGWLSSLLTDEDVPLADRLKTTDKLKVAQMIIDLNNLKIAAINDPSIVIDADIENDIKKLSVDNIKEMLNKQQSISKDKYIQEINKDNLLSNEEIAYLKTLSVEDLKSLLEDWDNKNGK